MLLDDVDSQEQKNTDVLKSIGLLLMSGMEIVLWIIEDFFMVLLQRFFYVTEVADGRNRLHFYLKCVYQRMRDTEIQKMRKEKILERVPTSLVTQIERDPTSPGFGSLRFMPKEIGCRPISYIK
ncbi:hypothetical protein C0J52_16631 [Blattella germanica]|nr:hypothetical protein C0J52_16631 [Blattella germanica]